MFLVFIWIQGSWKWTQARILSDKLWFDIFETWQILRNIATQDTKLWKLVRQTIQAWKQLTPSIVEDIIKDYLQKTTYKDIIFDWLVRNIGNKKTADKILGDYKVVFFDLDQDTAMKRLLWRMYNPKTWETFPAWTITDPKTWDKLIKRSDDEENAIKQRIKEFFDKTMPVIKEYEKNWNLIKINANQPINKVTEDILNSLK